MLAPTSGRMLPQKSLPIQVLEQRMVLIINLMIRLHCIQKHIPSPPAISADWISISFVFNTISLVGRLTVADIFTMPL